MLPLDDTTIARFNAKVDRSGGPDACWPWTAGRFGTGYGAFKVRGRNHHAHRIAYELAHDEPIPSDPDAPKVFVCHACDNPPCCNPAHLWLGTTTDNMRDASTKGRLATGNRNGSRTHPDRIPRGDRHGSRTKPDRVPRGDRNGSRTHPERRATGDRNGARLHPDCLARGDRHGSRTKPEQLARGEKHGKSKLTSSDVLEIRAASMAGEHQREIGLRFGVSQSTISCIVKRKTWQHIPHQDDHGRLYWGGAT